MNSNPSTRLSQILAAVTETNSDDQLSDRLDSRTAFLRAELDEIASLLVTGQMSDPASESYDAAYVIQKLADLDTANAAPQDIDETQAFTRTSDRRTDNASHPKTIGEYELIHPIGRGGFGTVYHGRHQKLARDVAIKLLHRQDDPERATRFEKEMMAIGRLSHPNIVSALDARDVDGTQLLVTELIDGCNLWELVQQSGPLPIAESCQLIGLAATGLQYIHEQNLVHRDIKPGNLMLSRKGELKILDLGLALLDDHGHSESWDTATGQIVGTIDYLAPEQLQQSSDVDIRADIYSLGATFYWLLTGATPFGHKASTPPLVRLADISVKRPIPIHKLLPDIPRLLSQVIMSMLARNPEDRYSAPSEIAEAVAEYSGEASLATLLSDDYVKQNSQPVQPLVRSNRTAPSRVAIATACTLVVLIGLAAAYSIRPWRPNAIAPREPSQTASRRSSDVDNKRPVDVATHIAAVGSSAASDSPLDRETALSAIEYGFAVSVSRVDGRWEQLTDAVPDDSFNVRSINGGGDQLTDIPAETLDMWCRCPMLKVLTIYKNRSFTKAHATALARRSNCKALTMGAEEYSNITDTDLIEVLQNCRQIERLSIYNIPVTGAFLSTMPNPSALKALYLRGRSHISRRELVPQVSVQAIRSLQDFKNLEELNMTRVTLSDEHLIELAKVHSLVMLNIGGTHQVLIEGIRHLSDHPRLQTLEVHGIGMDDAFLPLLAKIKTLNHLDISHNELLTRQGIENLQATLPDCEILFHNTYPGT